MSFLTKKQIVSDLFFASYGYGLNRNLNSTGFCMDSGIMQNDAIEDLSEFFLLNSNIDNTDMESVYHRNRYLQYPFSELTALSSRLGFSGLTPIRLDKEITLDMGLSEVISRRKSSRKYSGDFVPQSYVASILRGCAGTTHTDSHGYFSRKQRTCASGGGLYPIFIYILVNRVRSLDKGIYLYSSAEDGLYEIEKDSKLLQTFIKNQSTNALANLKDCCFMLFFIGLHWRSSAKYSAAGFRFMLIELGEICQNAHLIATALGMGCCDYASLNPTEVKQILKIHGSFQSFQHAALFGIHSGV